MLEAIGLILVVIGLFYLQICRWDRIPKDSEEWRILCAFYDVDGWYD